MCNLYSTPSKIGGYVYDKNTGEELCGVRVTTECDTTYTDFNGHFEVTSSVSCTRIQFKLISYEEKDTIVLKNNELIISRL